MKYIVILLVSLLTAPSVFAAENPLKQNKSKNATSWKPSAFDETAKWLPANYTGINPINFYKMFKGKVDKLEKGKYETSEEFERRIADKDALLAPINTTDLYAFRMEDISAQYDADAKAYRIGVGFSCDGRNTESSEMLTCKVGSVIKKNSTYTGSNAYGVSRTVKLTKGLDFALAIPKSNPAVSEVLSQESYERHQYNYKDNLPVPLEKARVIKDEVAVLFVGRVIDARIVYGLGDNNFRNPTLDSPYQKFIKEEAVPFDLKKIIYYVKKTGEMLYEKSF